MDCPHVHSHTLSPALRVMAMGPVVAGAGGGRERSLVTQGQSVAPSAWQVEGMLVWVGGR